MGEVEVEEGRDIIKCSDLEGLMFSFQIFVHFSTTVMAFWSSFGLALASLTSSA